MLQWKKTHQRKLTGTSRLKVVDWRIEHVRSRISCGRKWKWRLKVQLLLIANFQEPPETCRVLIISTISAICNHEFEIEKPAGKSKKIIWTTSRNTHVSPLKFIHWQLFIGSSGRCFAVWSYKKRLFYDEKQFFYYKKRLFYVLHSMSNI